MTARFRVRAMPFGGEPFIIENFEARSDADAFYEVLQAEESNILEATPYDCVVIDLSECLNGEWSAESRRIVDIRDKPRFFRARSMERSYDNQQ